MAHSIDHEILEYLSLPDNLPLSFEIASYVDRLRPRLLQEFWTALQESVLAAHPAGRNHGELVVKAPDNPLYEYASLRAFDKSASEQTQNVGYCIQHHLPGAYRSQYPFQIGIVWKKEIKDRSIYADLLVRALKDRLCSHGYRESPLWWIALRNLVTFPTVDELLCTVRTDCDGTVAPLTAAFWELVDDTEAEVAEINKLVASC